MSTLKEIEALNRAVAGIHNGSGGSTNSNSMETVQQSS